jgi:hypothetical protein
VIVTRHVQQRFILDEQVVPLSVRVRKVGIVAGLKGPRETERSADAGLNLARPVTTRRLLDDHAGQDVVGVGIVPAGSRLEVGGVPERDGEQILGGHRVVTHALEVIGGEAREQISRVVMKPARVLKELADGYFRAVVAVP